MTVDLQLTGMRALVTRGTKGIGVSVVEALYDAGARVVTTARTVPRQRLLYRGGPDERGRSPRGLRTPRLGNRRRGAPDGPRTSGLLFRHPSIYPAELRGSVPPCATPAGGVKTSKYCVSSPGAHRRRQRQ